MDPGLRSRSKWKLDRAGVAPEKEEESKHVGVCSQEFLETLIDKHDFSFVYAHHERHTQKTLQFLKDLACFGDYKLWIL